MTQEQLQENIHDSLVRLRRQYELCLTGYNRPALKDLAHILRIWADMSNEAGGYLKQNKPAQKFIAFSIHPRFNRAFRNSGYIVGAFPNGIALPTKVVIDEMGLPQHLLLSADTTNLNAFNLISSIRTAALNDGFDRIEHVISVWNQTRDIKFTQEEHDLVGDRTFEFKKVGFDSWLNSSAIRVNIHNKSLELIKYDISRRSLIRRVANIMGGSHPEGGLDTPRSEDDAIKELMNYRALDFPLPYLILLTIASDVLNAFD